MSTPRAFGFRQTPNAGDMLFSMAHAVDVGTPVPTVKRWRTGPVLDQGAEGACVGFACKHLLTAEPHIQAGGPSARELYLESRLHDEFDDRLVPEGTSVRAGLQTLKRHGLIQAYWWAPNVDFLAAYIAHHGPAVVGTQWYGYETESDSRVRLSGRAVGGHAWVITGYDLSESVFFGLNSWGESFGHEGQFYVTMSDFARELTRGGVAAGIKEK